MKQVKAIIVILFLLLVVILAVQNYQALSTPISFRANLLFMNAESSGLPVFLIAVVTFIVGVICTWAYGISERLNLKRQIKALMRDVNDKEKELNSLRNLPVTTEDMSADQSPANT
ncbi:MAG: LapA family protein [Deltaproteobacteria bacterium]|nr:LapA family protein [Deltaproteobacteria bacterium]MBW2047111.1 LapA family protein [Deltaproteobacteria bacterium]MBW2109917.1 LapA family protein [Deltaproteobacteria bacterium]MBW2351860.1 LapA family protein [Deltaproteobacteria bacterium]HDZ89681.1 LapA family protein [Deltaproteobacteria bacterium]